jgi:asparagine synthase (glutamine-hydrolysing)
MCGICGEWSAELRSAVDLEYMSHLTGLMVRRGPDSDGLWTDGKRCSLGFRRLAILDLSPAGQQPMLTRDKRYAIVYNGEVYNFRELRQELERDGVRFRSTGDTEVVLYALARWGTTALERFNGMFALAFYDTVDQRLLLARDHAGIKPLYYLQTSRGLVFASQYNQILAHPWSRDLSVSQEVLALYLRLGYIPAPYAILDNTHMLEAGTWLAIEPDGQLRCGRYFEFSAAQEPDLTGQAAYEAVDAAVTAAVRRQLVSDVPVGTFLSGGIDSPLVAAKMQAANQGAVRAFTIGTNGDPFDETADAAAYVQELAVQHIVEHFSPEHALAMVDDVISACGEPFGDYSVFPTMLISRVASKDVKVMLSGDGGDELFWGYSSRFGSIVSKAADFKQPYWLRSARWGFKKFGQLGNGYPDLRQISIGHWYRAKHTRIPEIWLRDIFPTLSDWPVGFKLFDFSHWQPDKTAQWLRWNEFIGHLTMVLLKVDRASMFHSLEVRVPLLDREVIEIASRIDWKSCLDLDNNMGKLPLRYSLARHVQYQTKQKRGFSVPMDAWLRGPLRTIFEDAVLGQTRFLGLPMDRISIKKMFQQHLSGQRDFGWGLWVLLSLALWQEKHYLTRYKVGGPVG